MAPKSLFLFALGISLLVQCGRFGEKIAFNDPKDARQNSSTASKVLFKNQQEYDSLIRIIDADTLLTEVGSLEYEDNFNNRCMAKGWLDAQKSARKISLLETSKDGKEITTDFYFHGDQVFFAKQTIYDYKKKSDNWGEIFSYFGPTKNVIFTGSKIAASFEELQESLPKSVDLTAFDATKALSVINQKGPFETRYQGHLETEMYRFIIVGTSGTAAQTSSIAYNDNYPVAIDLVKKHPLYKNKLLRVNFSRVTELGGLSYQGLKGIQRIDE